MLRLWNAFLYSLAGIRTAWLNEQAFRLEVWVSVVATPLAFWITPVALERGLLISTLLLVLMAELINTAIEAVVDRIGPEIHPLSKCAKDCGSAAVLFAALIAGVIWLTVILG